MDPITVEMLGGSEHTVPFTDGMTIGEALQACGISLDGKAAFLNNRPAEMTTQLSPGDMILTSPRNKNGKAA